MSLALHGHQILVISTLAFAAAVLTPNWYSTPNGEFRINVFQVCSRDLQYDPCRWTFSSEARHIVFSKLELVYPIVIGAFALACTLTSVAGLLLGSWYLERSTSQNPSRWLLFTIIAVIIFCFLFSCAVWVMMLTTNLQHKSLKHHDLRLSDMGFSFWINIGASSMYLYVLIVYLISICFKR